MHSCNGSFYLSKSTHLAAKRTAILGFGNPVREDDGVGVLVAQELADACEARTDIDVFDMGTSAFEILYKLSAYDHMILVDAVINSGEPVGTLFKLPVDEIEASIEDDPLVFLHSLKWDQAIAYARKMLGDTFPETFEVYLIAIDSTRFNTEMTDDARQGASKLIDLLKEEINNIPETV